MNDPRLPNRGDFAAVTRWCQEYLELQHTAVVGRAFGALLRELSLIALAPRDGVDRFEWLKEREVEVGRRLGELADAYHKSLAERPRYSPHREPARDERGTQLLFVYGTLKRGFSRHHALAGQQFLGESRTQPRYRIFDCGGYPGLVEHPEGRAIEGEVWAVDAEGMCRLDEVEGVELRLYERRRVELAAPWEAAEVVSYFYCRRVDGLRDCGESWQWTRH